MALGNSRIMKTLKNALEKTAPEIIENFKIFALPELTKFFVETVNALLVDLEVTVQVFILCILNIDSGLCPFF